MSDDETVPLTAAITNTVAIGVDGSRDTYVYGPGTAAFTETHRYLDDDPSGTAFDDYPVTLTLLDDDGGLDSAAITVTVSNRPPQVEAGPDQVVPVGTAVLFQGLFTDSGTLDSHTFTWDFGDGHSVTGTLTPAHSFTMPGVHTVILTVADDDGGVADDEVIITVEAADKTIFLPMIVRD